MAIAGQCRVYEQEAVREVTGQAIRPGGLALTRWILAHCPLPAGASILDIGCGAGVTAAYLRTTCRLNAIGLDLSARLLQSGQTQGLALPLLQAPGERLPLADGCLDVVLAECSLSVMADPVQVLAGCYRVLRPGGQLILSDVYARQPAGIPALRRLPIHCCLRGVLSCVQIIIMLTSFGFGLCWWADRSDVLKHFAGQLIMSHGSLAEFWGRTTAGQVNSRDVQAAVSQARPGYLVLLAEKKELF